MKCKIKQIMPCHIKFRDFRENIYDTCILIKKIFVIWAASWLNQQCGCASSEDSDQPGHPPSLIRVFAVRMKKAWVLIYPLSAQRRLWSDWADAQADLSLRWAHSHIVGFVTRRLIYLNTVLFIGKMEEVERQLEWLGHHRPLAWQSHPLRLLYHLLGPQTHFLHYLVPLWVLFPAPLWLTWQCSIHLVRLHLSLVTRKPVSGVCDQGRLKPACAATEAM